MRIIVLPGLICSSFGARDVGSPGLRFRCVLVIDFRTLDWNIANVSSCTLLYRSSGDHDVGSFGHRFFGVLVICFRILDWNFAWILGGSVGWIISWLLGWSIRLASWP